MNLMRLKIHLLRNYFIYHAKFETNQSVPFTCQHVNKLSYAIASESDVTPFIKINKPLVVYKFSNVMQCWP